MYIAAVGNKGFFSKALICEYCEFLIKNQQRFG